MGSSASSQQLEREIKYPFPDSYRLLELSSHQLEHFTRTFHGIQQAQKTGHYCDIFIVFPDKFFMAHLFILAFQSLVFRRMAESWSGSNKNLLVKVSHVRSEIFQKLLEYIYTGFLDINKRIVAEVSLAAIDFEIEEVFRACIVYVSKMDTEQALYILLTKNIPETSRLFQLAVSYILRNYSRVYDHRLFVELPADVLCYLICDNQLEVSCELQVLDSLLKWTTYRLNHRKESFDVLVKCIRFENMSKDELVYASAMASQVKISGEWRNLLLEACWNTSISQFAEPKRQSKMIERFTLEESEDENLMGSRKSPCSSETESEFEDDKDEPGENLNRIEHGSAHHVDSVGSVKDATIISEYDYPQESETKTIDEDTLQKDENKTASMTDAGELNLRMLMDNDIAIQGKNVSDLEEEMSTQETYRSEEESSMQDPNVRIEEFFSDADKKLKKTKSRETIASSHEETQGIRIKDHVKNPAVAKQETKRQYSVRELANLYENKAESVASTHENEAEIRGHNPAKETMTRGESREEIIRKYSKIEKKVSQQNKADLKTSNISHNNYILGTDDQTIPLSETFSELMDAMNQMLCKAETIFSHLEATDVIVVGWTQNVTKQMEDINYLVENWTKTIGDLIDSTHDFIFKSHDMLEETLDMNKMFLQEIKNTKAIAEIAYLDEESGFLKDIVRPPDESYELRKKRSSQVSDKTVRHLSKKASTKHDLKHIIDRIREDEEGEEGKALSSDVSDKDETEKPLLKKAITKSMFDEVSEEDQEKALSSRTSNVDQIGKPLLKKASTKTMFDEISEEDQEKALSSRTSNVDQIGSPLLKKASTKNMFDEVSEEDQEKALSSRTSNVDQIGKPLLKKASTKTMFDEISEEEQEKALSSRTSNVDQIGSPLLKKASTKNMFDEVSGEDQEKALSSRTSYVDQMGRPLLKKASTKYNLVKRMFDEVSEEEQEKALSSRTSYVDQMGRPLLKKASTKYNLVKRMFDEVSEEEQEKALSSRTSYVDQMGRPLLKKASTKYNLVKRMFDEVSEEEQEKALSSRTSYVDQMGRPLLKKASTKYNLVKRMFDEVSEEEQEKALSSRTSYVDQMGRPLLKKASTKYNLVKRMFDEVSEEEQEKALSTRTSYVDQMGRPLLKKASTKYNLVKRMFDEVSEEEKEKTFSSYMPDGNDAGPPQQTKENNKHDLSGGAGRNKLLSSDISETSGPRHALLKKASTKSDLKKHVLDDVAEEKRIVLSGVPSDVEKRPSLLKKTSTNYDLLKRTLDLVSEEEERLYDCSNETEIGQHLVKKANTNYDLLKRMVDVVADEENASLSHTSDTDESGRHPIKKRSTKTDILKHVLDEVYEEEQEKGLSRAMSDLDKAGRPLLKKASTKSDLLKRILNEVSEEEEKEKSLSVDMSDPGKAGRPLLKKASTKSELLKRVLNEVLEEEEEKEKCLSDDMSDPGKAARPLLKKASTKSALLKRVLDEVSEEEKEMSSSDAVSDLGKAGRSLLKKASTKSALLKRVLDEVSEEEEKEKSLSDDTSDPGKSRPLLKKGSSNYDLLNRMFDVVAEEEEGIYAFFSETELEQPLVKKASTSYDLLKRMLDVVAEEEENVSLNEMPGTDESGRPSLLKKRSTNIEIVKRVLNEVTEEEKEKGLFDDMSDPEKVARPLLKKASTKSGLLKLVLDKVSEEEQVNESSIVTSKDEQRPSLLKKTSTSYDLLKRTLDVVSEEEDRLYDFSSETEIGQHLEKKASMNFDLLKRMLDLIAEDEENASLSHMSDTDESGRHLIKKRSTNTEILKRALDEVSEEEQEKGLSSAMSDLDKAGRPLLKKVSTKSDLLKRVLDEVSEEVKEKSLSDDVSDPEKAGQPPLKKASSNYDILKRMLDVVSEEEEVREALPGDMQNYDEAGLSLVKKESSNYDLLKHVLDVVAEDEEGNTESSYMLDTHKSGKPLLKKASTNYDLVKRVLDVVAKEEEEEEEKVGINALSSDIFETDETGKSLLKRKTTNYDLLKRVLDVVVDEEDKENTLSDDMPYPGTTVQPLLKKTSSDLLGRVLVKSTSEEQEQAMSGDMLHKSTESLLESGIDRRDTKGLHRQKSAKTPDSLSYPKEDLSAEKLIEDTEKITESFILELQTLMRDAGSPDCQIRLQTETIYNNSGDCAQNIFLETYIPLNQYNNVNDHGFFIDLRDSRRDITPAQRSGEASVSGLRRVERSVTDLKAMYKPDLIAGDNVLHKRETKYQDMDIRGEYDLNPKDQHVTDTECISREIEDFLVIEKETASIKTTGTDKHVLKERQTIHNEPSNLGQQKLLRTESTRYYDADVTAGPSVSIEEKSINYLRGESDQKVSGRVSGQNDVDIFSERDETERSKTKELDKRHRNIVIKPCHLKEQSVLGDTSTGEEYGERVQLTVTSEENDKMGETITLDIESVVNQPQNDKDVSGRFTGKRDQETKEENERHSNVLISSGHSNQQSVLDASYTDEKVVERVQFTVNSEEMTQGNEEIGKEIILDIESIVTQPETNEKRPERQTEQTDLDPNFSNQFPDATFRLYRTFSDVPLLVDNLIDVYIDGFDDNPPYNIEWNVETYQVA